MKKSVFLRFFAFFMAFSLIFSALSVTSFAADNEICVSIGKTELYKGQAPDAATFEPVYYKNGGSLYGSEADYNAKLEFDADEGFILTLNGLDEVNAMGKYTVYANVDINMVLVGVNKITHTVHDNVDKYAIRIDGKLSVSGEGGLDVVLRGKCDYKTLGIHVARAYNIIGADKINVFDGRTEEEKQIESIQTNLTKTQYDLAEAKRRFDDTTKTIKAELSTVKTIALVALVVGALSLVANVAVFVWIFSKRQSAVEADDEE